MSDKRPFRRALPRLQALQIRGIALAGRPKDRMGPRMAPKFGRRARDIPLRPRASSGPRRGFLQAPSPTRAYQNSGRGSSGALATSVRFCNWRAKACSRSDPPRSRRTHDFSAVLPMRPTERNSAVTVCSRWNACPPWPRTENEDRQLPGVCLCVANRDHRSLGARSSRVPARLAETGAAHRPTLSATEPTFRETDPRSSATPRIR
jgi:hypothetical protein